MNPHDDRLFYESAFSNVPDVKVKWGPERVLGPRIVFRLPVLETQSAMKADSHITVTCVWKNAPTMFPAGGRQHRGCIVIQTVTHSLVLLKMGKIISRKMLS
jgi:hypothetical protein